MKYLVIGSEGFIGKEVCKVLKSEQDSSLIKVDCVKPIQEDPLTSCYKICISETRLLSDLCKNEDVDVVFNLAGIRKGVRREDLFKVNCFNPVSFLEALAGQKCKVVLLGSAAEYGIFPFGVKVCEDAPLFPVSDYGISKACQTFMALGLARKSVFPQVIIARPFNIIGRGISEQLFLGSFSLQIARIEKGIQPPVLKAGNLKSLRDFLPLNEFAHRLKDLAKRGKHAEVYNICSGQPQEIGKILEKLLFLSKVKIEIRIDPERLSPDDIGWAIGDNTKFARICKTSFSEDGLSQALDDALNWYREKVRIDGR